SCSRHQYAELVFEQTIETWVRLHRAAFEYFGGVPRRVVLDNLRAAIVHAALYDPEVQRSYRECAEHYGFLIAPCRPRTPEHKGKVEQGGVHFAKRNALAGRAFRDVHDGNRHLLRWCVEVAGRRLHGTTKRVPLEVFDQVERPALGALPLTPWELAEWKQAKLHADCHVVFGGAYYSGPHRLIGEPLWVRAAGSKVELFHEYVLVATHRRARPGQRRTLVAHLPPEKVHFLLQTPAWCHERATEIGAACALFIDALLGDRPLDRLRGAQGVLRLAQRYGAARVDAACARAHAVGEYRYHTVKTILVPAFDPTKPLESFDFSFNPKLNKAQVFDLATCQYIERHESVLVFGPTGVGKSHLAQALAHEACRRGHEVLFMTTDKMLTHLAGGRADGTREQRLARYTRPDLLILDDFGLKPLRAPGPEDLYDVINERYERGSIVLTSNRDRAEWA